MLLLLPLAAALQGPAAPPAAEAVEVRTRVGLERPPYAGERFPVGLELELDTEFAGTRLVQLFRAPLDLPLQVDTGWTELPELEVEFAPRGETGLRLVLDEAVHVAARGSSGAARTVAVIDAWAVAARAGTVTLPAPVVRYRVATAFEEDFVRGRVAVDTEPGVASGEPLTLRVAALPEEGRPTSFRGAIGTFGLEARLRRQGTVVDAGAPFEVLVTVTGDGRLPRGAAPSLDILPAGLTQLGAAVRLEDPGPGTAFRLDLVAERPGDVTVPAARLVHFDPGAAAYRTASTAPLDVPVRRAAAVDPIAAQEGAASGSGPRRLPWTIGVLGAVALLALVSALRRIRARREFRDGHGFGLTRVGFISKYPRGSAAGNAVAIEALGLAFARRGVETIAVRSAEDAARCDVLHAFHGGAPARRARDLAAAAGIPYVVTVTGTDLNSEAEAADPDALRDAATLIALTEGQAGQLDALGVGERVVFVPQAIDFRPSEVEPEDPRRRFGLGDEVRVALMLGGLRPVKGQDLALEAMAQLAARDGEDARSWRIVILGASLDDPFAERLRGRTPANAAIHPPLPRAEALALLRGADALVNASESEGESRAILEAQALGTPVVARRNPGNRALLLDGEAGLLFDGPSDLADALERLAGDGDLRPAIVHAAQAAVLSRPDLQEEALATLRIYARARRDRHLEPDGRAC